MTWQQTAGIHVPSQRQAPPAAFGAPTAPAPRRAEPPTPSQPPATRSSRTATTLKIAFGTAVGLLLGLVIGSAGRDLQSPDATATSASAIPAGGGRFRVGPDLTPGTYQTSGEDGSTSTGCYYARLRTGDGAPGDIVDNYVSQGPMTVVIARSDAFFVTSGCSAWSKVN